MDKRTELEKDSAAVELIHANALRILEEIGITLHSEGALALLRENGVRVEGNRAYFAENTLDTIEVCAKNGQPLVIAPGNMAGATGPISLAGNVSLACAEFLGLNVFAQTVRPGTPVVFGFTSTVSDMRDMLVSNANPGFTKEAKYGALMAKRGARGHSSPATRHRLPDACAWFRGMICRYARNQDGSIYGKRKSGILRRRRHASSR